MDQPSKITRYFTKPRLAKRYGNTTRSIDRWRAAGKFPPPDMYLPNGQPAWTDETIEKHERASVPNARVGA
jgi:hypothetical protein